MKIKKIITSIFLLVVTYNSLVAQTKQLDQADYLFNTKAYALAIDAYKKVIEKGETSLDIYKKLGDAYYLNANYKEAANCYAKLITPDIKNSDSEYLFKYAQTLRSIGNYEEANKIMLQFNKIKNQDLRASKFIEKSNYLENIKNIKQKYILTNLESNSAESDFAPSFYKDTLVFSSARDTGFLVNNVHEWNNRPFLNLHTAVKKDSSSFVYEGNFAKELNTKTHESSTTFTKDGKTVYFTRNNSEKGKFSPDKNGLSRLKVYKATLENGNWTNVTELPFNSDEYSVANPTLNYAEDKLYFASDMPGTLGASDIFAVDINTDGSFGNPENLGDKINTEGRETFPFISEFETLYFASDGHPGLGGLDIFYINLTKKDDVYNMGKGINSKQDDFSIVIDETKNEGFLASNRPNGKGSDDIYSFIGDPNLMLKTSTIKGTVVDKESNDVIPNAAITVYNYTTNAVVGTATNNNGIFISEIKLPEKKYKITAKVPGYANTVIYVTTPGVKDPIEDLVLEMEKSKADTSVGSDLTNYLKLKSIYFDTNSSYLRVASYPDLDKVAKFMKENPTVAIEVGAHTDSTESDTYNLWLSKRRAKSTVNYLISKGVDSSKITGVGFGESQLLNKCSNGVKCSSTEHAINRRSEFIIINK
ncbi:OmpA family protein [Cellulophaga fucicola]|uniref:WD40-like Beta Propeller Repeat n=1 Tax=Cellulophaga fucicola TaxID=76595 RepID=A0A1K1N061_9FLAO|nr:OmpA family protein [Cellulophaga fucicola]SFW27670.1 WD40-like Beta Propeller Repeat [Cellulophaga fucicola]